MKNLFSVLLVAWFLCVWAAMGALAMGEKKSDSSGSASSSSDAVWVYRKDGGTACGLNKGQTLEQGAADLTKSGAHVLDSHKANDGKMHAMACGLPTGSMNAYQISRSDLPKAVSIGFIEVPAQ